MMGGDRQDKCRATPSLPTGKVWRFDIVCALDVVSSYECRLCVTFPIKPLMLRCPSSASVQLWPLLLRKGPAPPPPPELGVGPRSGSSRPDRSAAHTGPNS